MNHLQIDNAYGIMAIGFLAQAFFSARILVQWLLSERAKKVLSPSAFWVLSLAGAYLLCLYGWLRNDFSIVLGQFISYYIYLWNLHAKGVWTKVPRLIRYMLLLVPMVALTLVADNAETYFNRFFHNEEVPLWLLIYGSAGQVLFTLRFVYQWYYSYHRAQSSLPAGFWLLSLAGSLTIVSYGCIRSDIVLIIGQSFGLVAYIRNLCLLYQK
ncbi:MAG: lipid-A-disaccharide synthase N-terminal domain-containing protein [Bacteroidaceae bacterium]